jgi:hypothetical protein
MFGRGGSYIVKSFTTVLLCIAGCFGADLSGAILTYVLFAVIWQREPEALVKNEVDELDFARGALGIASAMLVAMALCPML